MATTINLRAGDTEPFDLTISASGLSSLDDLTSAVLYAKKAGAAANHVTAGALTVSDSATLTLTFDPAAQADDGGDAFDEPGTYRCYVLATWSDGDTTRHPDDSDLEIVVRENYE